MSSMNAGHIFELAHNDALRFRDATSELNIRDISEADARRLMSEEHKALGYRPPPGSLAAQAQAAIAKGATEKRSSLDEEEIRKIALKDAERIKRERERVASTKVDVEALGEEEARKLMSDEHKALGYRPPPQSLAAAAQAAAAKHPNAKSGVDDATLERAALDDAARLAGASGIVQLDVTTFGAAEARKLMSEEHKALGYRPPPDSLAAKAQAAAAKHPDATAGVDPAVLARAALEDAKKIRARRASNESAERPRRASNESERPRRGSNQSDKSDWRLRRGSNESAKSEKLNLQTITAPEARALQSAEHKELGHRPPADSLAAQAQSAVDTRGQEPVTKEMAASLESEEHKARGHLPESGTIAPVAQSLADKNENDGGERKLADVGL